MKNKLLKFSVITLCVTTTNTVLAARLIDLNQKDATYLTQFFNPPTTAALVNSQNNLHEINQQTDFNQTLHVRMQQTYLGYPVYGGEAIVHIPHGKKSINYLRAATQTNSTVSGAIYSDLQNDLKNTSNDIFSAEQAQKALTFVLNDYKNKNGRQGEIQNQQSKLMVYVDENTQAHWVYHVRFYVKKDADMPELPNVFVDAITFKIYKQWNDIQTLENVKGGGFGGNPKMGKIIYDGVNDNLPALDMQRDAQTKMCYLLNENVSVTDFRTNALANFSCENTDSEHNNIFWDADFDKKNQGYSPDNDALYAGKIIHDLYLSWYNTPVLSKDNHPMLLEMITHSPNKNDGGPDNAYWDPELQKMFFGDGKKVFYPLTSLGVAAHEISHGFTSQHSNLEYDGQSGGMNESFSDMAAQAAEYYRDKHNSWTIGADIGKAKDFALRYMDKPTKDCAENPEECSIDNARDYKPDMNVHFSSGIYNRAFYLLATSAGWDVKKAFDVMVQANSNYWIATTNFKKGACGVMHAAQDYKYDVKDVANAFQLVGIETQGC